MKLPDLDRPIRVVGLTGNIGTGKSTVAQIFTRAGIGVVDADETARAVVAPKSPGLNAVTEAFGIEILAPDGSLDRKKIAALVFDDENARKKLEGIIHPLVAAETSRRIEEMLAADPGGFAVYDVPLLFETGIDARMDLTVVVTATREQQIERVIARSGLLREEIESRMAAQMNLAEKTLRADIELKNDGPREDLERQVAELIALIRAHNATKY